MALLFVACSSQWRAFVWKNFSVPITLRIYRSPFGAQSADRFNANSHSGTALLPIGAYTAIMMENAVETVSNEPRMHHVNHRERI